MTFQQSKDTCKPCDDLQRIIDSAERAQIIITKIEKDAHVQKAEEAADRKTFFWTLTCETALLFTK